jgi:hypothetical protein
MEEKKVGKFRSVLKIGNLEIPCFVTEDGTRVLSGRGITTAIGMKGRGQGITRILTLKSISPKINNELSVAIQSPLHLTGHGLKTYGYEATILIHICETILKARDEGDLSTDQEKRYAKYADILVRAFAKVGIIALIDEATGYQKVRDKLALQKILDKYLREDFAKWAKTFPDEFYEGLFRLKGWQYSPMSVKRPGVVAHWTKDLIYKRLAPGVLEELQKRNPTIKPGRRKHKLFTLLTEDYGVPAPKDLLSNVIFLINASPNWQFFYRALQRAAPKYGDTIPIDYGNEEAIEKDE